MHMIIREIIPGRQERVQRCPLCGTRSPCSHYDVILILRSFATELATPSVTDVRTYVCTYGHLTTFNILRFLG